jgi:hypothetical protein
MAYVPGFANDIFLNYPIEAEAWTRRFEEDLKSEPLLTAAKGLKIYFAKNDWRLGEVSDKMLEAARNSAIFVSVLTKDSLADNERRFLQREMEAFGESGPLEGRFCPIPLYPIGGARLAKAMPIGNGAAFWNANEEFFFRDNGIPLPLGPDTETQPGQYRRAIGRVAHQLRERLDELRSRVSMSADSKGAFAGVTVLLAGSEPGSSIEQDWQKIRNLLVNDGATVVTNATPRDGIDEVAAVLGNGRRIDLFVQLFSALDNLDRAKATLKSIETRKSICVLQWRKKHPVVRMDAGILSFLDEEDRRFCESETVQTGSLEDFKLAIRDKLDEITKPPPERIVGEKPYLYITADAADLPFARELQAAARKRTDADIMLEDKSGRLEDFEDGLKLASGIVFLHGRAKRQFVDLWLKHFIRKTRLAKLHPRLAVLYQAPPEKTKDEEPLIPIDELRVVGSQKEFTLQGIERICAELCGDRV